jgi:lipopolysaccharide/colanic/teichoic acid biosynthesis glycosyltransferase
MPGITGLWQVNGRTTIADFDKWIDLDLRYARQWSVWLDLLILLKTPIEVFRMRGAA